jgi:membrane protein implicated in regulation of membrane protease activity
MFGVTYFAGSVMAFLALLALVCMWLGRRNLLKEAVNAEHYHDIGKLMFAFMVFWSYTTFSQYFLIQYADLPEETGWFYKRMAGNWPVIGATLCIGHFLVPFAFLLSRHMKRNRTPLAIGAILLLVMHWIDMQFIIMPNKATDHAGFAPSWLDVTTMIGLLCIFLGLTIRGIAATNLFPVRDPKLRESLKFTNI